MPHSFPPAASGMPNQAAGLAHLIFCYFDRDSDGHWNYKETSEAVQLTEGRALQLDEYEALCWDADADPLVGLTSGQVRQQYDGDLDALVKDAKLIEGLESQRRASVTLSDTYPPRRPQTPRRGDRPRSTPTFALEDAIQCESTGPLSTADWPDSSNESIAGATLTGQPPAGGTPQAGRRFDRLATEPQLGLLSGGGGGADEVDDADFMGFRSMVTCHEGSEGVGSGSDSGEEDEWAEANATPTPCRPPAVVRETPVQQRSSPGGGRQRRQHNSSSAALPPPAPASTPTGPAAGGGVVGTPPQQSWGGGVAQSRPAAAASGGLQACHPGGAAAASPEPQPRRNPPSPERRGGGLRQRRGAQELQQLQQQQSPSVPLDRLACTLEPPDSFDPADALSPPRGGGGGGGGGVPLQLPLAAPPLPAGRRRRPTCSSSEATERSAGSSSAAAAARQLPDILRQAKRDARVTAGLQELDRLHGNGDLTGEEHAAAAAALRAAAGPAAPPTPPVRPRSGGGATPPRRPSPQQRCVSNSSSAVLRPAPTLSPPRPQHARRGGDQPGSPQAAAPAAQHHRHHPHPHHPPHRHRHRVVTTPVVPPPPQQQQQQHHPDTPVLPDTLAERHSVWAPPSGGGGGRVSPPAPHPGSPQRGGGVAPPSPGDVVHDAAESLGFAARNLGRVTEELVSLIHTTGVVAARSPSPPPQVVVQPQINISPPQVEVNIEPAPAPHVEVNLNDTPRLQGSPEAAALERIGDRVAEMAETVADATKKEKAGKLVAPLLADLIVRQMMKGGGAAQPRGEVSRVQQVSSCDSLPPAPAPSPVIRGAADGADQVMTPPGPTAPAPTPIGPLSDERFRHFRHRLINLYERYRPEKLPSVVPTLAHCRGHEEHALGILVEKFGPEPAPHEDVFHKPLLQGWDQVFSPAGDIFYINSATRQKQWWRPVRREGLTTVPPPPPQPAAPAARDWGGDVFVRSMKEMGGVARPWWEKSHTPEGAVSHPPNLDYSAESSNYDATQTQAPLPRSKESGSNPQDFYTPLPPKPQTRIFGAPGPGYG